MLLIRCDWANMISEKTSIAKRYIRRFSWIAAISSSLVSLTILFFIDFFGALIVQGICTTVVDIPIAKIIVHENYVPTSVGQENDIALVRLQNPAPYADYIRPICLPNARQINKNLVGEALTVAGFGRTENGIWKEINMNTGLESTSKGFWFMCGCISIPIFFQHHEVKPKWSCKFMALIMKNVRISIASLDEPWQTVSSYAPAVKRGKTAAMAIQVTRLIHSKNGNLSTIAI